jgi:tRNA(adenine34) deaminase
MHECPFDKIFPSSLEKDDLYFMSLAYNAAIEAWRADEVPIGAVIVNKEEVIATAYNQTRQQSDPTAHAEMLAITMAARAIGDWRLNDCSIYVTKEPCPMCSGATIMSRLGKVVYALPDPKMGCLGGASSLHQLPHSNHRPDIISGIMQENCEILIQSFFKLQRSKSPLDENCSSSLN